MTRWSGATWPDFQAEGSFNLVQALMATLNEFMLELNFLHRRRFPLGVSETVKCCSHCTCDNWVANSAIQEQYAFFPRLCPEVMRHPCAHARAAVLGVRKVVNREENVRKKSKIFFFLCSCQEFRWWQNSQKGFHASPWAAIFMIRVAFRRIFQQPRAGGTRRSKTTAILIIVQRIVGQQKAKVSAWRLEVTWKL